jgi:hypothetical protein
LPPLTGSLTGVTVTVDRPVTLHLREGNTTKTITVAP